jgi:hypothetical protein
MKYEPIQCYICTHLVQVSDEETASLMVVVCMVHYCSNCLGHYCHIYIHCVAPHHTEQQDWSRNKAVWVLIQLCDHTIILQSINKTIPAVKVKCCKYLKLSKTIKCDKQAIFIHWCSIRNFWQYTVIYSTGTSSWYTKMKVYYKACIFLVHFF